MSNFYELVANYLERWGQYCREHGQDLDWRSNQYELNEIARIVRSAQESEADAISEILVMGEELEEMEAVWG